MIDILTAVVHASSGSGDGGGEAWFLLAGPLSGIALYAAIFRYYRNTDKSHRFEQETIVDQTAPITGDDVKVDEVRGTRETRIRGDNVGEHRQRVQRVR